MQARYEILASCLGELHRVGVLDPASPMPLPFSQLPAQPQVGFHMKKLSLLLLGPACHAYTCVSFCVLACE